MMFGWRSLAAVDASRRKRLSKVSSPDLVDAEATQLLADVSLRHGAQAFTEESTATKLLCFNEFGQRESKSSGEYT
jgi:hypothetical protein